MRWNAQAQIQNAHESANVSGAEGECDTSIDTNGSGINITVDVHGTHMAPETRSRDTAPLPDHSGQDCDAPDQNAPHLDDLRHPHNPEQAATRTQIATAQDSDRRGRRETDPAIRK